MQTLIKTSVHAEETRKTSAEAEACWRCDFLKVRRRSRSSVGH